MNSETNKTLIFIGVAVVVCAIALFTRPAVPGFDTPDAMVGQLLTSELKDPASLNIVRYSEAEGKVKEFSVAQKDKSGPWTLPSHSDYPADAKDQLGSAAAALSSLKVLAVPSQDAADQAEYGVVDPGASDYRPGAEGAGIRVVMKSRDGKDLAALVIGKEVAKSKGVRYVRQIDQDAIYEVALQTDKLSSEFGDWIEKDLLKMDTSQIKDVQINDYSVDALQGAIIDRSRMRLEYNDAGTPAWKMVDDRTFGKDGKWAPVAMAADEEVKTSKLDDMRFAFGGLQIVNVARKPKGLSQFLRGTKDAMDAADRQSLQNRGFFLTRNGDLVSSEGEILATMKDGVRYVLRFGGIAGRAESAKDAKAKDDKSKDAKAGDAKEKTPAGETTRYLFVMCEFDRDAIAKPKEEPLPPEPKADPKTDPKKEPPKPADAKTPAKEAAKDAAKEEAKPDPKAERERIAAENKKNREDYEAKIKAGEKKVQELNERFADWYYEIKDSEYQKIHFGRKDIVQKKEKKEGETTGVTPGAATELPKDTPADLAEPLKGGAAPGKAKPETPVPPKTEPPAAKPPAAPSPTPPAAPAPVAKPPAAPASEPAKPATPAAKPAEPAKTPTPPAAPPAAKSAEPAKK